MLFITVRRNRLLKTDFSKNKEKVFFFFRFWLGGAAPQTPRFLAGGAKPPQTPLLNGRSSHLIEAAKRGRLDQMIFFSAPLTTRAPPTTVRPDVRPKPGRMSGRTPGRTPAAERPAELLGFRVFRTVIGPLIYYGHRKNPKLAAR